MEDLSCFKPYDIRGKIGVNFGPELAYKLGRAYGDYFKPKNVVIGCDIRLSSEEIKQATAKGLMDTGVDVIDIGLTGTEEIYFATWDLDVGGGIEITASHNPIDYNGMKMVGKGSVPISENSGLLEIRKIIETNNFREVKNIGTLYKKSNLLAYVHHLLTYINVEEIIPLKIVVNSGNGAAVHIIDAIEDIFKTKNIPITFIKLHHKHDGSFPNGIPNPLLPENRSDTIAAIIESGADLGIAWDGDCDRCFFFDEKGKFIESYYIIGILAEMLLIKHNGGNVIHDPRLTWNTIDIVHKFGGTPVQSRTGHSFIKEKMREIDAIYGGEMSAHHYFKDFKFCDSGMIPWLLVVSIISSSKKSLSELVGAMKLNYPSSGEINIHLDSASSTLNKVLNHYEPFANNIDKMDGISIEFNDWRFNLRSSNTEPLVRLNVETKNDPALLELKVDELLKIINQTDNI